MLDTVCLIVNKHARCGKAWQGFPMTAVANYYACDNRMTCQPWQGCPLGVAKSGEASKHGINFAAGYEIEPMSLKQQAGPTVKLSLSIIGEGTWLAIMQVNEVYHIYVEYVLLPLQVCLEESRSAFSSLKLWIMLRSIQSWNFSKVECNEIHWLTPEGRFFHGNMQSLKVNLCLLKPSKVKSID